MFLNNLIKAFFDMNVNELFGEALKELTYEHEIFLKRIEELKSLLKQKPLNAIEEFIIFLEKVVFPHRVIEEEKVFPVILMNGERE